MISIIVFILLVITTAFVFGRRVMQVRKNILLGRDIDRSDQKSERLKLMTLVAIGQSKMVRRPIAGLMHILIYVGFVIINIEILEILIDGLTGSHRVFLPLLGGSYTAFISSFEILAVLVILSCVVFLARRNIIRLKRFWSAEMTSWPRSDANIILVVEILLMVAFLSMDAADQVLQTSMPNDYHHTGSFFVSAFLVPFFEGMSASSLMATERFMWWFHIVGILAFLNYVPYSKHFHIFLAFPNVFYSNLSAKGQMNNLSRVTDEVKLMMDPNADPYAAPVDANATNDRFGAKDVADLSWKQLMDAYTCTECGRCSSNCPANQTGKLLSPRKIMMDTRDRLEEFGKGLNPETSLLGNYITEEELWACTTCNACTESCPVNIDPLSIILDMRRYLVMEESKMPSELMTMSSNIENNGAPWQFAAADRANWRNEG
ncbi:MAG: 4Fe-4S dicluster domain-containing protein [Vicingaceae bacterium]